MEIPHVPKYFIIIIMVPPACLWPFCAGGPTAGASAPQSCRGRIASLDLPAELALTQPSMLGMFFLTQPHLPHCVDRSQNSENLQERKNTASLPDPGPKDGGLRCLPQMCSQFVLLTHSQHRWSSAAAKPCSRKAGREHTAGLIRYLKLQPIY